MQKEGTVITKEILTTTVHKTFIAVTIHSILLTPNTILGWHTIKNKVNRPNLIFNFLYVQEDVITEINHLLEEGIIVVDHIIKDGH